MYKLGATTGHVIFDPHPSFLGKKDSLEGDSDTLAAFQISCGECSKWLKGRGGEASCVERVHSGFGKEKVMAERNATFRATQVLDKGLRLLVRDGNTKCALGAGANGGT